jgi:hypothetical protein
MAVPKMQEVNRRKNFHSLPSFIRILIDLVLPPQAAASDRSDHEEQQAQPHQPGQQRA